MRLTLCLAFTLSLSLLPCCGIAEANDFSKLLESFSGTATGWQEFDKQKVQLSAAINSAQATGQLTKVQADDFQQQLEALNQQEIQAKSSGGFMSFVQSISFNKQFNALTAQIETAIAQGKVTSAPDVVNLRSSLSLRIDNDVKSGRLSENDAKAIKTELAHIASIETAFRAESNGSLSPKQTELLMAEINKVKARLDQEEELADSGARTLEFRRQALEKKVSDGLAQGRLAAADSQAFKDELSKTLEHQKSFQSANKVLTGGQVLQLAGELDSLGTRIDAKLASSVAPSTVPPVVAPTDDFPEQFSRIDHRISRNATSGRITPQDAENMRRDLNHAADLYQAYKLANPVLTAAQSTKLNSDLEKLYSFLDSLRQSKIASGDLGGGGPGVGAAGGGWGGWRDGGRGQGDRRGPGGEGRGPGRGRGDGGRDGRDRPGQGENAGAADDKANLPVQVNADPKLQFPIIAEKEFTDISGYWAQPYISQLANRGVIGGFPNGTFRPDAKITRAQFAAIAASALKLPSAAASNNFTDVPEKYWAAPVIAAASNAGLIGGFPDGSFKPEESLTRAQALVILSKALKSPKEDAAALSAYTDAQAVPSWASQSVTQAASSHIIVNFPDANQIRPNSLTVRGEVAGLMYQTLSALGADLPKIKIGVAETK